MRMELPPSGGVRAAKTVARKSWAFKAAAVEKSRPLLVAVAPPVSASDPFASCPSFPRLTPDADLRHALEAATVRDGFGSSFVISGMGSLTGAALRLAGDECETRLAGLFEIVSLSGSITPDGTHLHMAVADSSGRVVGGHVCHGNEIRTAAEILLARSPDRNPTRELDAATSYEERVVMPSGGFNDPDR